MVRKLKFCGAELHVDSLNVVKQPTDGYMPDIYHITATVNKEGKPTDRAVAALCSTPFPEVADIIKASLALYFESQTSFEVDSSDFNGESNNEGPDRRQDEE